MRRIGPALGAAFALATIFVATPAAADFRLCNNTGSRVGIAIGYKDAEGWTTEGWWNLAARSCETLVRGTLVARFYYVYAVDYDRGGEWSGQAFMCTRDKEFTIRGIEDCLARGFDRTGFFEVDTGEQRSWTVQLTEIGGSGAAVAAAAIYSADPDAAGRPNRPSRSKPNETAAPHQDRRDARSGLVGSGHDRAPVRGRRRRVPHQHEPHLARRDAQAACGDPRGGEGIRAGRSAFWPTCRARSCASARSRATS